MCVVTIPSTKGDVGELVNKKYAGEKDQFLWKVLPNIRFLARQALPIRGNGKGEPNLNFNELYHLWGEDNLFSMEWTKRKGSNYTSHDIQEEMLKVMALKIFREIAAEIRSAEFYAIKANEISDISSTNCSMI